MHEPKPYRWGDEIPRAVGLLPQQSGVSITEASGQRDLGLAARTDNHRLGHSILHFTKISGLHAERE
jgi:hypothetical protein